MFHRQSPIVFALALLLSQSPAAPAQSFLGLPPVRTNPTPQVSVQPQSPAQVLSPQSVPNLTIPIVTPQGGTILPTDSLSRPLALGAGAEGRNRGAGERRVFEVADLAKFLAQHGWDHGVAEPYDESLLSEEMTTIDTDLPDHAQDRWLPISYITGGEPAEPVAIRFTASCPEVAVFATANQYVRAGISGGQDTVVAGAPGTVISHRGASIALYSGSILVDTGKEGAGVITRSGVVVLPEQTTAMVTVQGDSRLTVQTLAEGAAPVAVRLTQTPDHAYVLKEGQSLTVDLTGGHNVNSVSITDSDASSAAGEILSNRSLSAGPLSRMGKHLQSVAPRARTTKDRVTPISEATVLLGAEGTRFVASANGTVGLISGRMLVGTQTPQVVRTQLGDIYLQPHSLTTVERWQGQMRVLCLSEPKSAILASDHFGLPLQWGEEALVTDHEPTAADMLPQDNVGRRSFEVHKLRNRFCSLADFSINALLCKAPHLHHVRKPSTRLHTDMRNRIMKTAASLQVVTGAKGKYYLQSDLSRKDG